MWVRGMKNTEACSAGCRNSSIAKGAMHRYSSYLFYIETGKPSQ